MPYTVYDILHAQLLTVRRTSSSLAKRGTRAHAELQGKNFYFEGNAMNHNELFVLRRTTIVLAEFGIQYTRLAACRPRGQFGELGELGKL